MIYLDTSAVVPVFVNEPDSDRVEAWVASCGLARAGQRKRSTSLPWDREQAARAMRPAEAQVQCCDLRYQRLGEGDVPGAVTGEVPA